MKPLLLMLAIVGTTACSPAFYAAAGLAPPHHRQVHIINTAPAPSPVGRWDNVMMLEPGTPLKVLKSDGTVVTGRFLASNIGTLRLDGMDAIAMVDVMRVDRAGTAPGILAKEGVKGAALGAGVAGVAGLIFGVTPPPRVFAGTAIVGAYQGAAQAAGTPGPGTIYLAPAAGR